MNPELNVASEGGLTKDELINELLSIFVEDPDPINEIFYSLLDIRDKFTIVEWAEIKNQLIEKIRTLPPDKYFWLPGYAFNEIIASELTAVENTFNKMIEWLKVHEAGQPYWDLSPEEQKIKRKQFEDVDRKIRDRLTERFEKESNDHPRSLLSKHREFLQPLMVMAAHVAIGLKSNFIPYTIGAPDFLTTAPYRLSTEKYNQIRKTIDSIKTTIFYLEKIEPVNSICMWTKEISGSSIGDVLLYKNSLRRKEEQAILDLSFIKDELELAQIEESIGHPQKLFALKVAFHIVRILNESKEELKIEIAAGSDSPYVKLLDMVFYAIETRRKARTFAAYVCRVRSVEHYIYYCQIFKFKPNSYLVYKTFADLKGQKLDNN